MDSLWVWVVLTIEKEYEAFGREEVEVRGSKQMFKLKEKVS